MNEMQTFYPWCVVAAFSDGSRLTFGGSTEEQARSAMEAASNEHGEISWWDHVTDTNYVDGQYYQLLPDLPTLHVVDLAGYDGPVDANGFPAGLPDKIARSMEPPRMKPRSLSGCTKGGDAHEHSPGRVAGRFEERPIRYVPA